MDLKFVQTDCSAQEVYLAYPYVLTSSSASVHVWLIAQGALTHLSTLDTISSLSGEHVLVDPSRKVAVIPQRDDQGLGFSVYNLQDGTLQRRHRLFGEVASRWLQYANGNVLITVNSNDEDWTLLCNLFDPNRSTFLTEIHYASSMQPQPSSSDEPLELPSYTNIFLTAQNGVISAAGRTSGGSSSLTIAHWAAEGQPDDSLPPSHTTELPITLENADAIDVSCSAPLGSDDTRFLLCTQEAEMDVLDGPTTYLSIIRAHSIPSLEVEWSASLWGKLHCMQYVPGLDVVVGVGIVSERGDTTNPDNPDYAHFIVALNAKSGEELRMVSLNHREQGTKIVACGLTSKVSDDGRIGPTDAPEVVIVFANGKLVVRSLEAFISEGFLNDDDDRLVTSGEIPGVSLLDAHIGNKSVVAIDGDHKVSIVGWYHVPVAAPAEVEVEIMQTCTVGGNEAAAVELPGSDEEL